MVFEKLDELSDKFIRHFKYNWAEDWPIYFLSRMIEEIDILQ